MKRTKLPAGFTLVEPENAKETSDAYRSFGRTPVSTPSPGEALSKAGRAQVVVHPPKQEREEER